MMLIDAEALKEMLCVRCMEYAECHKTGSEFPVTCPWKKAIEEAPTVIPWQRIEFCCPTCKTEFDVNVKTNKVTVIPADLKLID